MNNKPYIIRISSQKGGVGKTTVSVNLAVTLSLSSYNVLLIDADTSNPSVGFLVGLEDANIGYEDVVDGSASLQKAVITHAPSGLHVLPGTITSKAYNPTDAIMTNFMKLISKENYDFIIIDTAPGFPILEPAAYINEAAIITTPEMSSCTSSIRLARIFDKYGIRHNMIVNRIKKKRYEISIEEINELYGNRVLGEIPEDEDVPLSIADHIPECILNKRSNFSIGIRNISRMYASKIGARYLEQNVTAKGGIVAFLKRLFGIA